MDFSFTEQQNILRDSVRKMLDRVATPEYIATLPVKLWKLAALK